MKDQDRHIAEVAWRYFQSQTQPGTGLCNATLNYPSTTMWDVGSCFLAWVAAERLELVDRSEAERTLRKALKSLARMRILSVGLPNKVYNVKSLEMTDYGNTPKPTGVGWSALDIARLLISLKVVYNFAPSLRPHVDQIFSSWKTERIVRFGQLTGGRRHKGRAFEAVQEGRIGYEQYAALGLMKLGFQAKAAYRSKPNLRFVSILGHEIPDDRRIIEKFDAITVTTSDPYILSAFELGLTPELDQHMNSILSVQEQRFRETGKLTALGEAHLDRKPYFVYNSVLANGRPWAVINHSGKAFEDLRFFNTHVAFSWHLLKPSVHTERLYREALRLESPQGWYAGRFEKTQEINKALSANVNATILEAIHYNYYGPLMGSLALQEVHQLD